MTNHYTAYRLDAARKRVDRLIDAWADAAIRGEDAERRSLIPALTAATTEYLAALEAASD